MSILTRERPLKPSAAAPQPQQQRPAVVTRAELAPCTCPEHCERDHEND